MNFNTALDQVDLRVGTLPDAFKKVLEEDIREHAIPVCGKPGEYEVLNAPMASLHYKPEYESAMRAHGIFEIKYNCNDWLSFKIKRV